MIVFCYIWICPADERQTDRTNSPGGFEEAQSHAVNCLNGAMWQGTVAVTPATACRQPGTSGQTICRRLSLNSLNKLESSFFSSQASNKTLVSQYLTAAWVEDSPVMPRHLAHRNCEITECADLNLLSLWYSVLQQQKLMWWNHLFSSRTW